MSQPTSSRPLDIAALRGRGVIVRKFNANADVIILEQINPCIVISDSEDEDERENRRRENIEREIRYREIERQAIDREIRNRDRERQNRERENRVRENRLRENRDRERDNIEIIEVEDDGEKTPEELAPSAPTTTDEQAASTSKGDQVATTTKGDQVEQVELFFPRNIAYFRGSINGEGVSLCKKCKKNFDEHEHSFHSQEGLRGEGVNSPVSNVQNDPESVNSIILTQRNGESGQTSHSQERSSGEGVNRSVLNVNIEQESVNDSEEEQRAGLVNPNIVTQRYGEYGQTPQNQEGSTGEGGNRPVLYDNIKEESVNDSEEEQRTYGVDPILLTQRLNEYLQTLHSQEGSRGVEVSSPVCYVNKEEESVSDSGDVQRSEEVNPNLLTQRYAEYVQRSQHGPEGQINEGMVWYNACGQVSVSGQDVSRGEGVNCPVHNAEYVQKFQYGPEGQRNEGVVWYNKYGQAPISGQEGSRVEGVNRLVHNAEYVERSECGPEEQINESMVWYNKCRYVPVSGQEGSREVNRTVHNDEYVQRPQYGPEGQRNECMFWCINCGPVPKSGQDGTRYVTVNRNLLPVRYLECEHRFHHDQGGQRKEGVSHSFLPERLDDYNRQEPRYGQEAPRDDIQNLVPIRIQEYVGDYPAAYQMRTDSQRINNENSEEDSNDDVQVVNKPEEEVEEVHQGGQSNEGDSHDLLPEQHDDYNSQEPLYGQEAPRDEVLNLVPVPIQEYVDFRTAYRMRTGPQRINNEVDEDNSDDDVQVVDIQEEEEEEVPSAKVVRNDIRKFVRNDILFSRLQRYDDNRIIIRNEEKIIQNCPNVVVIKNSANVSNIMADNNEDSNEDNEGGRNVLLFSDTFPRKFINKSNLSLPGCSKDDYTDSNTTIRNMLRSSPRSGYSPLVIDTDRNADGEDNCFCLSPHEDQEDDEDMDELEWTTIWRKRKHDGGSTTPTPQQCKKFCFDGSVSVEMTETVLNPPPVNKDNEPRDMQTWLNSYFNWSKYEKFYAIESLIHMSAASQVRHMMQTIEPLLQRDFISLLPKELALEVLGYLAPKDLLVAARTCRYWRFLADDNLLWKEQCRRINIKSLKKNARYLPRFANPWKSAYMKQYLIENNWMHKNVNTPMLLRGHEDHVITCLQFYGNRILSGSDDTTLKVWSAVSGKCLRTLVGHAGGVWSSQMIGDVVVSGSTDRSIRVWEASTGMCRHVLMGHTSTVRCLHLHKDIVVSGSRDATLRMWSVSEGRCIRILLGHLAAVRCVQYDGKVIVSGAYDFYVKVWNPDTGECIHTLTGHTNRVYSLQFDGIHIVSGSLDTSIKVWDVETGQLKHTLVGHQSLTSGMELHSNILVSGNADSTVKVWDINTGRCLHTLSGPNKHHSAVTCLQSTNRFVITSSDDGTVKLWDLHTGQFIRNLVELNGGGSGGVVWRIRASGTKLICAVGSRNGTEETKLIVLDFDVPGVCRKCDE